MANTTGYENSFFGTGAGESNISGNQNSAFGKLAGVNLNSYSNSLFVGNAGMHIISGNENTAVGDSSGFNNVDGNQNAYLGFQADAGGGSFSNATAIGSKALVSSSNSMVLGSIIGVNGATASVNVGIGTATPLYKLHVANNIGSNGFVQGIVVEATNAGTGGAAISFKNTGTAGTGPKLWIVGLNQGRNLSFNYGTSFSGGSTQMTLDTTGRFGIGTTTPGNKLHVIGTNLTGDGLVMENTNAGTGETSISFKNTGNNGTGIKLWTIGLNEGRDLDFNYGTQLIGGNTKMVIDSIGLVGIGNITPTEKLDVTGNIKLSGEVNRPTTGVANLVPICYGNIRSDGSINTGSGNFTVSHTILGIYEINITGESYFVTNYITVVTPNDISPMIPVTSTDGSGNLEVRLFTLTPLGNPQNASFAFVVYKP